VATNRDDFKRSSQALDNASFNDTFQLYGHIPYETDGINVKVKQSDQSALQIKTSGTDTFVGFAPIGTATSSASWQAMKVDTNGNITWADGNSNFDNIADNLTSLSYS